MVREHGSVGAESAAFAQTLGTLKRQGSNILLVGTSTSGAHEAVCHRLRGEVESGAEPGTDTRYRLFVTDTVDGCSIRENETETSRTIEYADMDLAPESNAPRADNRTPLSTLGIEIIETIDAFDEDADGLEAAELRVCIDSLVRLLHEYDTERVFRLLHMTTSRVEHARGMGHYHLPLERDHDAVNLLEPMFDAIVELRARGEEYEQQWYLCDRDTTTEWIPI
ncbi:DUF7504 family protein [Halopiger djelfimassiliensis]|uniref:DUF7504 family protein n=1 Tax=Halopiger djelfimassiliensis TaxID=1293047 RepID=UPI0006775F64|nr:hypothetical protein [Halopiger djelfimassiliensis]